MCSRKCETPISSGRSSRVPVLTQKTLAADCTPGICCPTSCKPLSSLASKNVLSWRLKIVTISSLLAPGQHMAKQFVLFSRPDGDRGQSIGKIEPLHQALNVFNRHTFNAVTDFLKWSESLLEPPGSKIGDHAGRSALATHYKLTLQFGFCQAQFIVGNGIILDSSQFIEDYLDAFVCSIGARPTVNAEEPRPLQTVEAGLHSVR